MLDALRSLTEDAWQIPYSTRVDGITNFQHTWADGDELIVEDLVGPGEITEEVATRARDVALAEPTLVGRMVSTDARTSGINVRISLPGASKTELPEAVEHVRALLARSVPCGLSRPGDPRVGNRDDELGVRRSPHARYAVRDAAHVRSLRPGHRESFSASVSGIASTLTVLLLSTLNHYRHRGAPGRPARSGVVGGADDHPHARRRRLDSTSS